MRLLPSPQQHAVLQAACDFFRLHSHFKLESSSPAAPCGSSIRIISGEEEGLFGWIAVNYLMDGFTGHADQRQTYGFLDMGGASTQIAFEPAPAYSSNVDGLEDVRLRLLNGHEIVHRVFVTTWLGYGTNQARERYVGKLIQEHEKHRTSPSSDDLVRDPCLPPQLRRTETPVYLQSVDEHERKPHTLVGTGNFTECMQLTEPLLNKNAPCPDVPCMFAGKHVPHIDFSVSHFIGVSEYWYSSEHVFGLGGPYDFVQYERAAAKFCAQDWPTLVAHHDWSRKAGKEYLGGDGQVEEKGRITGLGKWGPNVELWRLEMQCFKAAWIVNVLHEGIDMPRIMDLGGNSTGTKDAEGDRVGEKAKEKGLGRPTFQSVDTIGDTAISWTLGKMVLEASKEVEPDGNSGTLLDPFQSPKPKAEATARPTRPGLSGFDPLDDRIADHIPTALHRSFFGFSLFSIILYGVSLVTFISLAYRMRHRVRTTCRRRLRQTALRVERDAAYLMQEEGLSSVANGGLAAETLYPRPPTPFNSRATVTSPALVKRIFTTLTWLFHSLRAHPATPPNLTINTYQSNGYTSDGSIYPPSLRPRISPRTNTFSDAMSLSRGGGSSYAPSIASSRASSPPPEAPIQATSVQSALQNAHLQLSRSRNSSSMSVLPRGGAPQAMTARSTTPSVYQNDEDI